MSNYNQKRICIHIWFFIPKQSYWLYKYIYMYTVKWLIFFWGLHLPFIAYGSLIFDAGCFARSMYAGGLQRSTYVYTACMSQAVCGARNVINIFFYDFLFFFSALISQNFCFLFWKKILGRKLCANGGVTEAEALHTYPVKILCGGVEKVFLYTTSKEEVVCALTCGVLFLQQYAHTHTRTQSLISWDTVLES